MAASKNQGPNIDPQYMIFLMIRARKLGPPIYRNSFFVRGPKGHINIRILQAMLGRLLFSCQASGRSESLVQLDWHCCRIRA